MRRKAIFLFVYCVLILFNRLDFHVGLFSRVVESLPLVPIDAVRKGRVVAAMVTTVQV